MASFHSANTAGERDDAFDDAMGVASDVEAMFAHALPLPVSPLVLHGAPDAADHHLAAAPVPSRLKADAWDSDSSGGPPGLVSSGSESDQNGGDSKHQVAAVSGASSGEEDDVSALVTKACGGSSGSSSGSSSSSSSSSSVTAAWGSRAASSTWLLPGGIFTAAKSRAPPPQPASSAVLAAGQKGQPCAASVAVQPAPPRAAAAVPRPPSVPQVQEPLSPREFASLDPLVPSDCRGLWWFQRLHFALQRALSSVVHPLGWQPLLQKPPRPVRLELQCVGIGAELRGAQATE